MKLQEIIKQRAEALRAINELTEKADAENRDFNKDEQAKFDSLEAEINGFSNRIEREQRRVSLAAKVGEDSGIEPADDTRSKAKEQNEQGNKSGWRNFGEFLQSVAMHDLPGASRRTDPRLQKYIEERAVSGMNTQVGSEGGFLVPADFNNELLQRVFNTGVLASKVRRIPISGNSLTMNAIDETSRATGSRYGGVQVYWVPEGGTATIKKPKLRQINMKVHKLMGLSYVTEENLEDAPALDAIVRDSFTKEMAYVVDDTVLWGDGSAKPLGIMNSGALVTVAKEGSQSTAGIVKENLFNMRARLLAANRPNSFWYINQDVEPALHALTLGDLGVYFPAGTFADQPNDRLFGRPVIPLEQCSTLGTKGDIVLADLSEYLWIDKGDIKTQTSIHVRFEYDEMCFKFTYRADGQPWMTSALTPAKGSNTLSSFVTLATRP